MAQDEGPERRPAPEVLEDVRRLAGPAASISRVSRLKGGQHADTWRVDTENPLLRVVVRQFPAGDPGPAQEQHVLQVLSGLGSLVPAALGGDVGAERTKRPTSFISWLDGQADINPADPDGWARQLGSALAWVHSVPSSQLSGLPDLFDHRGGSQVRLSGPLAPYVRSAWSHLTASPAVLTHSDYWSGNTVWRRGRLTGIVDWAGGVRGPRGFDVGWCRLDLVLLFEEQVADIFLAAYEAAAGTGIGEPLLWDAWAAARSHDAVESWWPNYAPLGRADLDAAELRRGHSRWSERLHKQAVAHRGLDPA